VYNAWKQNTVTHQVTPLNLCCEGFIDVVRETLQQSRWS